eukprot:1186836-Prorocentrum_minimum.AAC.2
MSMMGGRRPLCGGCYTAHGAFMRRQAEVAETFSELLVRHFVNADNIWHEIQRGERQRCARSGALRDSWREIRRGERQLARDPAR